MERKSHCTDGVGVTTMSKSVVERKRSRSLCTMQGGTTADVKLRTV